ncbi:MAG TPA: SIS domain-containing protein [Candidatus Acidoferrum sp.]|nr:SIS domain-containing protein [Candidatus Acidoferrum sp.]
MENPSNKEPNWIAGIKPPDEVLAMNITEIYEMECREQPKRLADLFQAYRENPEILADLERLRQLASGSGPVLFIGMGASYCASIAGSVWMQSCGRSSFYEDAGEWLHYAGPVWNQIAGTVLTTASGESAELVRLCKELSGGKPLVLLCNNQKSACWAIAKHRFALVAGAEYANATKTYTNAAAACILLASQMAGRAWHDDAEKLLDMYASALNDIFSFRNDLEEFCRGAANIELVGRGAGYGGAIMGSLCIREMTGKRAAAHTGAGFRHGPILDVNESHVAIISALGHTADLGVKLAEDCNARGGKVILVSSEDHKRSEKLLPVKIAAVPEPWEAITSVLAPQALTLSMIEKYGANLKPRFHYGTMKE